MNVLFKIVQDLLRKVTCRWCGHTQKVKDRGDHRGHVCERCGKKMERDRKQR